MLRRVIAGGVASATLLAPLACGTEPATDPGYGRRPHVDVTLNGSTDGRFHTCGYVTEDGVTEYIDVYIARCGDQTLAGDSAN